MPCICESDANIASDALVFPVDKAHWVQNSRYIRAFVPTPSPLDPAWDVTKSGGPPGAGAFAGAPTGGRAGGDSVDGLPQGDYYVVALDDLDSEAVEDPVLLEDLSRVATRIKLTDAAAAEVQLRRMKFADPGAAR